MGMGASQCCQAAVPPTADVAVVDKYPSHTPSYQVTPERLSPAERERLVAAERIRERISNQLNNEMYYQQSHCCSEPFAVSSCCRGAEPPQAETVLYHRKHFSQYNGTQQSDQMTSRGTQTLNDQHQQTNWCEGGRPPNAESLKYHGWTKRDEREEGLLLRHHQEQHEWWNVPFGFLEEGLKRPRDGRNLSTDLRSLADVDGDGVEVGEVVRAIFMMPPGEESLDDKDAGGHRLLYHLPHTDGEKDVSVVETSLRDDLTEVTETVEQLHERVRVHRKDLEAGEGHDTQKYLQTKAAKLAKNAAQIVADSSSEADKSASVQLKIIYHL